MSLNQKEKVEQMTTRNITHEKFVSVSQRKGKLGESSEAIAPISITDRDIGKMSKLHKTNRE